MVRHWFSLTAVLAVAVLIVAADASPGQLRERRQNRRARRNGTVSEVSYVQQPLRGPYYMDPSGRLVDSMGRPVVAPVDQGLYADTQADGRGANYPPDMAGAQRGARPVLLEVRVPANAEIWIDGAKTNQTGSFRQFVSPPIEPGRPYTYKVEAKWMDNGQERKRTEDVNVRPGQVVRLDLTRPSEDRPRPSEERQQ
jgi:uncharacterized protein (TIGR03000 family)